MMKTFEEKLFGAMRLNLLKMAYLIKGTAITGIVSIVISFEKTIFKSPGTLMLIAQLERIQ